MCLVADYIPGPSKPIPIETMVWYAVALVAAVIVMGIIVLWLRRRYLGGEDRQVQAPLTIEAVEEMHRRGLISTEEFSILRRNALGLATGAKENRNSLLRPELKDDDVDTDSEGGQPPHQKEQE